jgi:hypothetical protein
MHTSIQAAADIVAAEALREWMVRISEEYYSHGWLPGLELGLWQCVIRDPSEDRFKLVIEEIDRLYCLHARAGGWWRWTENVGPVFVPTEQWERYFAEHRPAQGPSPR